MESQPGVGLSNAPCGGLPLVEILPEAKIALVHPAHHNHFGHVPDFDVFPSPDFSLAGSTTLYDFTDANGYLVEEIVSNIHLHNRYAVKFLLCDIIVLQNFKPYGLCDDR